MFDSILQISASSIAKSGLAGAALGFPIALFGSNKHSLKDNIILVTILTTALGVLFGLLRDIFSTMVALGSIALCSTILISKTKSALLIPGALVTGGGIGYFIETLLKTAFVYSNRIALLSSLIGAVATITYHSPWRTGNFDREEAADTASLAVIGGAVGSILDFTLKAIKA